ncbi:MAG TPA: flagellar hook-associated protein FlgL [Candidatus Brocadiia bacterium]|nr:flagellar hook-associated protein FlgL [Candidatus Brocadiales bacterium]
MPTKVTQDMLIRNTYFNLQRSADRLQMLQEQLSSGKRINRFSDDPNGARKALFLHSESKQLEQFSANVQEAKDALTFSSSVLDDIAGTLSRIKDLSLQASDGSLTQKERSAIAVEVNELLESLLTSSNSTRLGKYIFSGTETDTQAFEATRSADGKITDMQYKGNREAIKYQIGPGINTQVNRTGDEIFLDNNIFSSLITLRDTLENKNNLSQHEQIQEISNQTSSIDNMHANILNESATLGGKTKRLELTENRLRDAQLAVESLRSDFEDADTTDVVLKLKNEENLFQAALASGARVIQPSLLDFLR